MSDIKVYAFGIYGRAVGTADLCHPHAAAYRKFICGAPAHLGLSFTHVRNANLAKLHRASNPTGACLDCGHESGLSLILVPLTAPVSMLSVTDAEKEGATA